MRRTRASGGRAPWVLAAGALVVAVAVASTPGAGSAVAEGVRHLSSGADPSPSPSAIPVEWPAGVVEAVVAFSEAHETSVSFGGTWLDPDRGTVGLAVVHPDPGHLADQLRAALPDTIPLDVTAATRPHHALMAQYDDFSLQDPRLLRAGIEPFSISPVVQRNALVITVARPLTPVQVAVLQTVAPGAVAETGSPDSPAGG